MLLCCSNSQVTSLTPKRRPSVVCAWKIKGRGERPHTLLLGFSLTIIHFLVLCLVCRQVILSIFLSSKKQTQVTAFPCLHSCVEKCDSIWCRNKQKKQRIRLIFKRQSVWDFQDRQIGFPRVWPLWNVKTKMLESTGA